MSIATTVRTVRARLLRLTERMGFLAPLLVRLTLGWEFINTGWGKLHTLSDVTGYFASLHIPMPGLNAAVASSVEFFGGILLLLGLGSRLVAIPMAFTMVVAILTARLGDLHDSTDLVGFLEFAYLIMFITIILKGPGAASLDALISRRFGHPPDETARLPKPLLRPSEATSSHV